MDNKELPLEKEYNAVVYCDGSCKPNPGFGGSGAHGYIYAIDDIGGKTSDKPPKNSITTLGYIEAAELAKYKELKDASEVKIDSEYNYMNVVPTYYVDGVYCFDYEITNNIAEILALTITLDNLLKFDTIKLKNITIKTDSMYVIGVVKNIMRDKNKSWAMEKDKPNLAYWKEIDLYLTTLAQLGITLHMSKVLGHSGDLANHLADRLANVGTASSMLACKEHFFHLTPAKKYWTMEKGRHPFLEYKQIYFTDVNRRAAKEAVYTVMNYPKIKIEPGLLKMEPGHNNNEATFGLVILDKPVDVIENIIDEYQRQMRSMSIISTIDLSAVYSQRHLHYNKLFSNRIYSFNRMGNVLSMFEELPIVFNIKPPGLANQAMERMTVLYDIINEYRLLDKIEPIRQYQDITDMVYVVNGKKVETIIKNSDKFLMVDTVVNDKTITIPIQLGIDCINRNQFKHIEKDDTKVYLVTEKITDRFLSYYILVEMKATNDISVWCNFFSNNRLLK